MLKLPRLRDLDPELRRHHLPFYLRRGWLSVQICVAVLSHFGWALVTIHEKPHSHSPMLQLSVSVFCTATTFGYFFARLGSRFMGLSLVRMRRGSERLLDSWLGRATVGCGVALVALPQVVNGLVSAELLIPIPFYSGAVVGMAFSFFLWVVGLPR